jgi:nucleotidyltransferase substrate binding protein (TIGR01987 family)
MKKAEIKFEKLQKALIALEIIYLKPNEPDRSNIDATIQRFEFTFELCWKFLKDFFSEKGISLNYPKEVIQEAFKSGVVDDENLWLQMLEDRNMTSHTYDEELANEIFERIKVYTPEIRRLCDSIVRY